MGQLRRRSRPRFNSLFTNNESLEKGLSNLLEAKEGNKILRDHWGNIQKLLILLTKASKKIYLLPMKTIETIPGCDFGNTKKDDTISKMKKIIKNASGADNEI